MSLTKDYELSWLWRTDWSKKLTAEKHRVKHRVTQRISVALFKKSAKLCGKKINRIQNDEVSDTTGDAICTNAR